MLTPTNVSPSPDAKTNGVDGAPPPPPPPPLVGESGDFGFDPLGLSVDPEMKKWMVQAELQHARWAMLGVAGMVGPDLAPWDTPSWIEAGKFEYWAPAGPLFFIQMAAISATLSVKTSK